MASSRDRGQILFLAAVFWAGFLLDLWTKHWARRALAFGPPVVVVRGLFELRYSENAAVAFSLLQSLPGLPRRAVVLSLTALALVGLALLLIRWWKKGCGRLFPLALLLAGASGNLYDRLVRGRVVDLFHLHIKDRWSWPIFNLADSLIVVGLALLFLLNRGEFTGRPGRPSGTRPERP